MPFWLQTRHISIAKVLFFVKKKQQAREKNSKKFYFLKKDLDNQKNMDYIISHIQ